jgi:hypothetical protein
MFPGRIIWFACSVERFEQKLVGMVCRRYVDRVRCCKATEKRRLQALIHIISGLGQARQAFNDAVKEFRVHVSERDCATWLDNSTTIYDVEEAVNLANQKYEGKSPKSRAKQWLTSCSSRLMYYSVIMDTLSQHHPEYVSLAWGALKFLFIVCQPTYPQATNC